MSKSDIENYRSDPKKLLRYYAGRSFQSLAFEGSFEGPISAKWITVQGVLPAE